MLSNAWDGATVRSRLAEMAQQDPQRRRFGADCHEYRLRPPLDAETVAAFERRLGVEFPHSYREFLLHVADGGAGPNYGVVGLTEEIDDEDALHGEREECLQPGFLATPFAYTEAWPGPGLGGSSRYALHGTLVVSEGGCGIFERLVVTGPCAGQVWCADPDWGGLLPGPDFRDWYAAWLAEDHPRRGGGPS